MSEQKTQNATNEPAGNAAASDGSASAKRPRSRKGIIAVAVVAVVAVVAGAGFWVWHEQPSFCGAICHTPMSAYVEMYEADASGPVADKWGNQVSDPSAMMSVSHAQEGMDCLDCHEPTLGQQMSEGAHWVTGDYEFPLQERNTTDLVAALGKSPDEFCLNEACHNMTRADLEEATADMGLYNPHSAHHMEFDCGTCHKAHRASVMYCTQCHASAEVPEGWLTADESNALERAQLS
ncbi:MAG: cytochrome c3 family protein [Eggerthellaceae bacterium]|nr:cytochrome c3 family protein [Eggerthellaceae bacterium]